DDLAVVDDERADRHFACLRGALGEADGLGHPAFLVGDDHAFITHQSAAQAAAPAMRMPATAGQTLSAGSAAAAGPLARPGAAGAGAGAGAAGASGETRTLVSGCSPAALRSAVMAASGFAWRLAGSFAHIFLTTSSSCAGTSGVASRIDGSASLICLLSVSTR